MFILCNGPDKDFSDPPDDTDTDPSAGTHHHATCEGTCDVGLFLVTVGTIAQCLRDHGWNDLGWLLPNGQAKFSILNDFECCAATCLPGEFGEAPWDCDDLVCPFHAETEADTVPNSSPEFWEEKFEEDCGGTVEITRTVDCVASPSSGEDHMNFTGDPCEEVGERLDTECCETNPPPTCPFQQHPPPPQATYAFLVDPVVSMTIVEVTGVGSKSTPMHDVLYVDTSPSEFLVGIADGPGFSLGSVTMASTAAWFNTAIDVSASGTSFTIDDADVVNTWAGGINTSNDLFEVYGIQPESDVTGSIDPVDEEWYLSYSVNKSFGTITVVMAGPASEL